MFFHQNRQPYADNVYSGLCLQPPVAITTPTSKSFPLFGLPKKSVCSHTIGSEIHLPASMMPTLNRSAINPPMYTQNRYMPDLRLWPHLDPRILRFGSSFSGSFNAQNTRQNSLVSMTPFSLPHLDYPVPTPLNYGRKMFRCSQCRYITDRRNNLKRHVFTMHQTCSKMLECCGIFFHTKASLREHSLIFHFNGYTCNFCGRRFCRKALLKRHLSVHSGQKDYICTVCDYATSHKSNLERHRKVHSRQGEEEPYDDAFSNISSDDQEVTKKVDKNEEGEDSIRDFLSEDEDGDGEDNSDWEIKVDDDAESPKPDLQRSSEDRVVNMRISNGHTEPNSTLFHNLNERLLNDFFPSDENTNGKELLGQFTSNDDKLVNSQSTVNNFQYSSGETKLFRSSHFCVRSDEPISSRGVSSTDESSNPPSKSANKIPEENSIGHETDRNSKYQSTSPGVTNTSQDHPTDVYPFTGKSNNIL